MAMKHLYKPYNTMFKTFRMIVRFIDYTSYIIYLYKFIICHKSHLKQYQLNCAKLSIEHFSAIYCT